MIWRNTMNSATILKGAFLAFCLVSLLALPAAAAQTSQGMNAKAQVINQGLTDNLWNNHITSRCRRLTCMSSMQMM
jgi:hypothetical protein